jgi:hypothetical protein
MRITATPLSGTVIEHEIDARVTIGDNPARARRVIAPTARLIVATRGRLNLDIDRPSARGYPRPP